MKAHQLTDTVQYWGAPDYNRRVFDSLLPIPEGTSYNAYLVRGSDKTVLIDTVDPMMADRFTELLDQVPQVDHVVSLHAEQDHSGSLPLVLERYPDATLLCSPKAKPMLVDLLHLPAERLTPVDDGATLSLGDRTLRFLHTPWVHWPETMVAYLEEERVLFSCDFFGSHLSASRPVVADAARVMDAAKRYYAGIMMPFGKFIAKHLDKLAPLGIEIIAPSHGPVHQPPTAILDAYDQWARGPLTGRVVIAYETMHHSTESMVRTLTHALVDRGVEVEPFRLSEADLGRLVMSLLDATTLVLGTPTVLGGPHPQVLHAAYLLAALRPRVEVMGVIASSGWAPAKTAKILAEQTATLSVERLEPVLCKGHPSDEDRAALVALADAIAAEHDKRGVLAR
ncbi:MAG: FprA family A-type flavoprotein [Deltaproteobacteria bacterium]|jgi:flavorubredoxin|nr:FprA family A-type flavoprotein [Deltaproteobacteria bacterium]MBW2535140.1 FprA family A-type flavoprotein [Deltaproteobacteria bacterium]